MSKIRLIDIKKSRFDFLLCDKLKKIYNLNKIIYEIKKAQKNKEKVVLSKRVKKVVSTLAFSISALSCLICLFNTKKAPTISRLRKNLTFITASI